MQWSKVILVLVMLVSLGWLVAEPLPAYADNPIEPAANCTTYVGLTNRIAGCIRDTVDAGVGRFFDTSTGFYPIVQKAIGATMTLAVIVYGILMMYGLVEKIGRDSLVFLLKIACVVAFTTNSQMIYENVTAMMDGGAKAAVSYTPPTGMADNAGSDFAQNTCYNNMVKAQEEANNHAQNQGLPAKGVVGPWLAMDCLLDTVIGIKVTDGSVLGAQKAYNQVMSDNNSGMARSLVFFFFSGMQTSIMGVVLAIIGFVFIYGLIMLIIKAFFTYIAAYLGIAFLVIISPLIIPLILFRHTKQYFDKWVKILISFAVQPVVMMVFITFSISAVDFAAFSGNYSIIYRIAGDASRQQGFDLNTYLTAQRDASGGIDNSSPPEDGSSPIITKSPRNFAWIKADSASTAASASVSDKQIPQTGKEVLGVVRNLTYTACTESGKNADPTVKKLCDAQYPMKIWAESIDWEKLAAARKPEVVISGDATTKGQQVSREVLSSVLFCCVVVFVLNGLLSVVPLVAYDLMGDVGQSVNIGGLIGNKSAGGSNPIAQDFSSKLQNMLGRR